MTFLSLWRWNYTNRELSKALRLCNPTISNSWKSTVRKSELLMHQNRITHLVCKHLFIRTELARVICSGPPRMEALSADVKCVTHSRTRRLAGATGADRTMCCFSVHRPGRFHWHHFTEIVWRALTFSESSTADVDVWPLSAALNRRRHTLCLVPSTREYPMNYTESTLKFAPQSIWLTKSPWQYSYLAAAERLTVLRASDQLEPLLLLRDLLNCETSEVFLK